MKAANTIGQWSSTNWGHSITTWTRRGGGGSVEISHWVTCRMVDCKVHILWEGHNFFSKSPPIIWLAVHRTNNWWRSRKILWPSHNIRTLRKMTIFVHSMDALKLMDKYGSCTLISLINVEVGINLKGVQKLHNQ